jgi:hypothetical protein
MTGNEVDFYDVQTMVDDEASARRRDIDELRAEIAQERVERQDAIESLARTLASRTEHLA